MRFQDLIAAGIPTLVDFHAQWCGPCKMMTPVLEELKQRLGDSIRILKIDVDRNPATAQEFQVRGVPTLILFRNGEVKWRQSGVVTTETLAKVVDQSRFS